MLDDIKQVLARQEFESLELTDDVYAFAEYLGNDRTLLRQIFIAYRSETKTYTHQDMFNDDLEVVFDRDAKEVKANKGSQWQLKFNEDDFLTLLASIDMVYSPIYPIGTVVELDIEMFPEFLQEMFKEEPGPKVMLTGRKLGLRPGYESYTLDYTARLWPLGEVYGSTQIRVSNMMIKNLISPGYSDGKWENQLVDALRKKQTVLLQRSSAFMTPQEALDYYNIDKINQATKESEED